MLWMAALVSCAAETRPTSPIDVPGDSVLSGTPIYVVLYTDLEDSMPESELSVFEAYPRYWDKRRDFQANGCVLMEPDGR